MAKLTTALVYMQNGVRSFMKTFLIVISFIITVSLSAGMGRADLINGGFETGDLSGWTLYGESEGVSIVSNFSNFYPREGRRIASFSKTAVLTYMLGLIEWGDTLFGQFTWESTDAGANGYGYVQIMRVPLNGDVADTFYWRRDAVRSTAWEYWQWTAAEPGYYELRLGIVNNNSLSPIHALFDGVQGRQVPLPGSLVLLGSGLLGLAGWRRFKKS
jgi:hypothetical protein